MKISPESAFKNPDKKIPPKPIFHSTGYLFFAIILVDKGGKNLVSAQA
jgi:hypothetical protein